MQRTNSLRANEQKVAKTPLKVDLFGRKGSAFQRYSDFFVGVPGFRAFLTYEVATVLAGSLPGAAGLWLRRLLFRSLFRKMGEEVLLGRSLSIRHPGKIEIGNRTAIDDLCILDARGAGPDGITIGEDVVIARNCAIQAKTSWIRIGNGCVIGNNCSLLSASGINIGNGVGIAGHCYIGGGRYRYENPDRPVMDQESFSKGSVVIEDNVWLGAGVTVLDGVRIARGAIIGAGAVVREDVPEKTVVTPHQKHVMLPRS